MHSGSGEHNLSFLEERIKSEIAHCPQCHTKAPLMMPATAADNDKFSDVIVTFKG